MSKLKEVNFWLVYIVVSVLILTAAIFIFYYEWIINKNKYAENLTNFNKISVQSTISSFRNKESTLKILGENLLELDTLNNPENGRKLINDMKRVNKGIVAFGLARYDGQLLLVSTIDRLTNLPNLMDNKLTSKSFEEARDSQKMHLGRSYFMENLGKWVIPIRMGVQDKTGKIPLVMTAGIQVDGESSVFNLKELPSDLKVQLIRGDGFIQFETPLTKTLEETYSNEYDFNKFRQIDKIKELTPDVITVTTNGKKCMMSVIYIEEYDLFSLVSIPYEVVTKDFNKKLVISMVLLFILLGILYFLFSYSIKIQTRTRNELRYIANHDTLTGVYNRYSLNQEISKRMQEAKNFYVFFLDLDNFKYINDTYGHLVGDKLLKDVAKRLKARLFKKDFIARNAGDEFIILIDERSEETVRTIAKKILDIFSNNFKIGEIELFTGVSIGISRYNKSKTTTSELLNQADMALYKAKENKNSYVIFSKAIYGNTKEIVQIETQLRQAIYNNEFSLVYQPKINSKTHEVIGVEALLRWNNKKLGFVSPEKFIKVAEKSGIINDIGEFVIKKAQADIEEVWKETSKEFTLSVNVSPRQLVSIKEMNRFKKVILNSSFPNDKFMIEITENIFVGDVKRIILFLNTIKSYNVSISLDDFGTGYSSLSILSKLPISELKIDKSFIHNMFLNDENMKLVKSIVNIGKDINLKVVAEGVEEQKELELLESFGCDIYQGYYFSKPLSKEELINFIKRKI
ncbi:EAL domain-containing protein [Halarcobacter sp.]|uniref:bifunctional diguanylate cyclase/phosphodiesterase n=1 Tax=Halarcobacter sp. TaxID=2321133 RepID=UPI003A8D85E9